MDASRGTSGQPLPAKAPTEPGDGLRRLGRTGPLLPAIGLGCMPLSGTYGRVEDRTAVDTICSSIDAGITLLDTADVYGLGHNERIVGCALAQRPGRAFVATKFGNVFDESGRAGRIDGSPAYVRQACEASLRRLGVDTIDLYQQHRVDPAMPIEETVGALAALVAEGKVRYIGLSEALPEDLRRASAVHPIASVQSEYSVFERGPEAEVLPTCATLGIGFLAYAPLGRGLLGGSLTRGAALDESDNRSSARLYPRVGPEHRDANLELVETVRRIAAAHEATTAQIALAWLLAQEPFVVPIPGTSSARHAIENAAASAVRLTAADKDALSELAKRVSGDRYGPDRTSKRWVSPPA